MGLVSRVKLLGIVNIGLKHAYILSIHLCKGISSSNTKVSCFKKLTRETFIILEDLQNGGSNIWKLIKRCYIFFITICNGHNGCDVDLQIWLGYILHISILIHPFLTSSQ